MKTNATRILDNLGIAYELGEYAVDPDDLSAETVAAKIGLAAEQVFKTLVVRGTQILLAPDDYLRAVNGKLAAIARVK
jgi:Cys-tRNA(Pro)/Cys-tRNA(Cys) deacylase